MTLEIYQEKNKDIQKKLSEFELTQEQLDLLEQDFHEKMAIREFNEEMYEASFEMYQKVHAQSKENAIKNFSRNNLEY
jgi:DNA-binding SARP family transcriptional activator